MSTRQRSHETSGRQLIDRRTAVERAVVGGAAFAVFGSVLQAQPQGADTGATPFRLRRVVTGHNRPGRSTVISDEIVTGRIWSTTETDPLGPRPPGEPNQIYPGDRPSANPPAGGSRVILVTFRRPEGEQPTVANRLGMHRTNTIDYQYVLTGAVWCILDEKEVLLEAGDIIIQRNTNHSWRVEGTETCRMMTTQVALRS